MIIDRRSSSTSSPSGTKPELWAVSVVIQNPETNEMFHPMGQFVALKEEDARQFVIRKALEKFPSYELISCQAIQINHDAIKAIGFVKVKG